MIRHSILYAAVALLGLVGLRRWYAGLCGLLFLTVLTQHPNMPESFMGMQGLNLWNMSFAIIVACWFMQRRSDPIRTRTPNATIILFGSYVLLIVSVTIAAVLDRGSFRGDYGETYTSGYVFIEGIVNPLKYVAIGLLFYDGSTTRQRVRWALFSAVGSGLIYSLLMFKSLKLRVFTMDFSSARRATDKLIGLFANDMAELMAFALWGGLLLVVLLHKRWHRAAWLLVVAAAVPAFLSLKSRAGYFSCIMIALVLGALRWRRILLLLPMAAIAVVALVPSVADRITTGFGQQSYDLDAISSGRTTYLWPPAIDQIKQSPLIGHGRYTLLRTDCFDTVLQGGEVVPAHPHNSYLEILLDAGIVGLVIVLACMIGLFRAGVSLLRPDRQSRMHRDPLIVTTGALAICAIVAELAAGVAGSSFYASQSTVPYFCVWGVALRMAVEKRAHDLRSTIRRYRAASAEQAVALA